MDDRHQPEDLQELTSATSADAGSATATDAADAADAIRFVCASHQLKERGQGVRFTIPSGDTELNAFVVRHRGQVHGYVNRCPHFPEDDVNLDKPDGKFFDRMGRFLECRRHSALFDPANGECVRGPCRGASLTPLQVAEEAGVVLYLGPAQS